MRYAATWLSIVPVVSLAACTQAPPPPPDTTEADEAAILASSDAFLAAFNAADLAVMAELYAEDAVAISPDGPPTEGRDAIVQSLADYFSLFTAEQTATTTEVSVHGDVAVARGTWSVRETPKAGGDEQVRNGKWLEVQKRQADGTWKVWRWIWNQETATAAPGS